MPGIEMQIGDDLSMQDYIDFNLDNCSHLFIPSTRTTFASFGNSEDPYSSDTNPGLVFQRDGLVDIESYFGLIDASNTKLFPYINLRPKLVENLPWFQLQRLVDQYGSYIHAHEIRLGCSSYL